MMDHTHTVEAKPAEGRAWCTGITTVDGAHHMHFINNDGTIRGGTGYHLHPDLKGVIDGQHKT